MNENFHSVPQSTTLEPNTCPLPQKECLEDKNRSGNFEKGVRVKLWGGTKSPTLRYPVFLIPSLLAPVPSSIPFEVIHSFTIPLNNKSSILPIIWWWSTRLLLLLLLLLLCSPSGDWWLILRMWSCCGAEAWWLTSFLVCSTSVVQCRMYQFLLFNTSM